MAHVDRPWVIPVDTVRVALARAGVAGPARFRPSAATELRHQAARLPAAHRRLAQQIAGGHTDPHDRSLELLPAAERAAVLGVAYDLLRYRYLSHDIEREASDRRARSILVARSAVDVAGPGTAPVPIPAVRPDEGHGTARFSAGAGSHNGRAYLDLGLRPAFHSLLDPAGGYTAGAQIEFLAATVRLYPESGDVRLQEFAAIDIVSLSPVDLFFRPISWNVDTGIRSRLLPGDGENPGHSGLGERYVWHSNGGAGITTQLWDNATAYGFVDASADVSASLQPAYALGPGLAAGVYVGPASDRWRAHVLGSVTRFALGEESTLSRMGVEARLTLTRQTALEARAVHGRDFDRDWFEGGVAWRVFF